MGEDWPLAHCYAYLAQELKLKKIYRLQLLKITRFTEIEYTFMRKEFSLDLQQVPKCSKKQSCFFFILLFW
jgi:hypothetical protein